MITWPRSPTTSTAIAYLLFPADAFNEPDFDAKVEVYRSFMFAVLDEDRWVIESQQRNLNTVGSTPGRMSVMEAPVHYVINDYLRRISP